MTDYQQIYNTQSELYDRMVSHEDYEGNLLPAIQEIVPLSGAAVVELGAGTGRVTELLLPHVRHIAAFDRSVAMLAVAANKLQRSGRHNWTVGVADNRWLPVVGQTADLVIAGWSLAHSVSWYPHTWQDVIGETVAGIKRVLKPGGTIILIETLGTGRETPQPPNDKLARYYRWLETVHGFKRTWVRTDYSFASVDEAVVLTRFFFGDELADRIAAGQSTILPECSGIWSFT